MKLGFFSMWKARDWAVGVGCGLTAFLVYLWTAAPNVTLLDSGEFLAAASHFGVPHPTGYPLWTLLCGLFQLLNLGNTAWEGNLFSGVCGGFAVGLTAALLHQSSGWLLAEFAEDRGVSTLVFDQIRLVVSLVASLTFAFSISMWSQAVITEVYTLHALLVLLYLISLYRWILDPKHTGGLVGAVFFWALGMSNHHLVLPLLALPVLLVLLLRRDLFPDFLLFLLAAGAVVFLVFAALSDDTATPSTARRFAYCVGTGVLILAWLRRGRVRWGLLPALVLAMGLGFLPYLYMPMASSTNPPMNWAYTRSLDGFYWSVNRSQYSGRLDEVIDNSVGRVLGSKPWDLSPPSPEPTGLQENGRFGAINLYAGFFWLQLARNFTPLFMLTFFLTLLSILYLSTPGRAWIFFLYVAFIIAAFLEAFFSMAKIDQNGWMLQMPYHTYTFAMFALVSGTGLVFLLLWLRSRFVFSTWWLFLLLAIPAYALYINEAFCSQRGKWFGWEFGHEMLKDMPQGSVLFGGTDPGRFIPTYMIFGESFDAPSIKRDPAFDRRDLYIITQNAVVDKFYLRYLRDQYGPERPPVKTSFEHWLGRDQAYPKDTLILPSEKFINKSLKESFEAEKKPGFIPPEGERLNSPIAQWLFEQNKDRHTFFIEESFPMPWSYPYALPDGLIYRLNPTPLVAIPPGVIKKDREFWTAYKNKLLANPLFAGDVDAQKSFSKLRNTMGNIYRFRQREAQKAGNTAQATAMRDEAYLAYHQALELWSFNPESVQAVLEMLTEEGKTAEAFELSEKALKMDPFNNALFQFNQVAYLRDKLQGEIRQWESKRKEDPGDSTAVLKLLELYVAIRDVKSMNLLIESAMKTHPSDRKILQVAIASYLQNQELPQALELARHWEKIEPKNERVAYLLARLTFMMKGNGEELQKAVSHALELGGEEMKEEFRRDQVFAVLHKGGALDALLEPPSTPGKSLLNAKQEAR